jgi:hypothetical protein
MVLRSVLQLLVTADIPSLLMLSALMMEGIRSFRMLVLTGATWHHIPKDSILQESILIIKNISIF